MALIQCPECKREISDKAESCPNCGFNVADKASVIEYVDEEHYIRNVAIGVIALIAVIVIFFKLFPTNKKSESEVPWDQRDNSVNAWVFTKIQVEGRLRNSNTARFPAYYKDYITHVGQVYTIKSYVDSPNSSGPMLRTYFEAIVKQEGVDSLKLVYLNFRKFVYLNYKE